MLNHAAQPAGNASARIPWAMLPPRRLFRSRWVALFWAGGVLWTAIDIAQSAPAPAPRAAPGAAAATAPPVVTDAMGDPADAADLAAIANAAAG